MIARMVMLAGAAGVVVAAVVVALPPEATLPAVTGGAALAFGLYALREHRARHLSSVLSRLLERQQSQGKSLATVLATLNAQTLAIQGLSTRLDQMHHMVGQFGEMGKELSSMHAAATTEVLTQLRKQRIELLNRLDCVEQQLGQAGPRLERVEQQFGQAGPRLERITQRLGYTATQTELRRLHSEALLAAARDFRQTEALLGLHSLFRVRAPLPPSRKWAASPDVLLHLASLVLDRRPRLVVELGGGLSTVWLSYAMEKAGSGGRIISLDHDARYASTTRDLLLAHDLGGIAEIRHAPLTDVELDGETWPWYDTASLADVERCDFLVVDGPPAATRDRARYPALPLLVKKLAENAVIVLDDCIRQDEKDTVATWREQFPGWHVEMLDHEKGTAVFTR